jgi:translation initiation factor IF-2
MAKPRVHEVAKELGLSSKEVLAHLEKIGEPVKSHASTIDEALAERVKAELSDGAAPAKAARKPQKKEPKARADPAKPAAQPSAKPAAQPAPTKAGPTPAKPAPAKPKKAAPAKEPARPSPVEPAPEPAKPAAQPPAKPAARAKPEPEQASAAAEPTPAEKPAQPAEAPSEAEAVRVHRGITVQEFASKLDRSPAEIVKILLGLGEMVTVTQSMSDEAVLLVADELAVPVEIVDPLEEEFEEMVAEADEDEGQLAPRPPVVTVMGHVDHGKTSILDAIRRTNVVAGEAGGITQHIGAYQVRVDSRNITFIDTPGHEAFTAMRARGAQVTDIAVLVVAADDGVMPQTLEAIDHARAAGVPIVVAVNKVDKPEADPTRVRQQLSDHGLLPEEWGGETIFVDVSAKQRVNLDDLLENILLMADVNLDLKANPDASARGHVIEAHLDKGRGPVATLLVKRGTLVQGDALLAGVAWGRVRAMLDENGNRVEEAHPGQPVQVLGWQAVPDAGDEFRALNDEKEARRVATERDQHRRAAELVAQRKVSLEQLLAATAEGEVPTLNIVLKADTAGSVEALEDQLTKLDQSLVSLNVIRRGVGAVTENDVTLAQASEAIVIGFNVVPTGQARQLADEGGVDVRTYRVIYQAVEDIEKAAKGLLGPERREVPVGQAEVRATFRVPRVGVVAGCYVTEGSIHRNSRVRLVRDGTVVYETSISSLRRFKEDVRDVATGYECGIALEGYQDIKEGDIIQAFEVQEVAR